MASLSNDGEGGGSKDVVLPSSSFMTDDKGASHATRQDVKREQIGERVEESLTLLSEVGEYRRSGVYSELTPSTLPSRSKSKDEDEDNVGEGITNDKKTEMGDPFMKESSQSSLVHKTGTRTHSGSWHSSKNSSPHGAPHRRNPVANSFNKHHASIGRNTDSARGNFVHFDEGVFWEEETKIRQPPTIPRVLGSTSSYLAFQVTRNELDAETDLMRTLDETAPLRRSAGTCDAVFSEVPIDTMDEPVHDFIITDDDAEIVGLPDRGSIRTTQRKEISGRERNSMERTNSVASNTVVTRASIASTRKVSPARVREGGHHRKLTLEEDLFGLNRALSFFKMEDKKKRLEDEKEFAEQHTDQASKDRAGDVFNTASILFDRITSADVSITQPSAAKPKTAAGMPNPLLDRRSSSKVPTNKFKTSSSPSVKQDGDDIEDGILEFGGFSEPRSNDAESEGDLGPTDAVGWNDEKNNKFGRFPYAKHIRVDYETVNAFWKPRRHLVYTSLKIEVLYIMLPSLCTAGILFYLVDNPPTGTCPWEGCEPRKQFASASWWVLFLGCRQVVIFTLAKSMELFLVDFLALRTTICLRLFGPMVTLLLVQWRGWPLLLFFFGLFNLLLTAGNSNFANHWLYWQDVIPMMNRSNPSGYVTSDAFYYLLCELAMVIGSVVGIKRLMIGLHFGRRTFGMSKRANSTEKMLNFTIEMCSDLSSFAAIYSKKLTSVMNKMLIMNELARFARKIAEQSWPASRQQMTIELLEELFDSAESEDDVDCDSPRRRGRDHSGAGMSEKIIDPNDVDPYTGRLNREQQQKIAVLLGAWEEPPRTSTFEEQVASVSAVMQFRRGLAHMDTDLPFGTAFGTADTREACVLCSQNLYEHLLLFDGTKGGDLHFNAIAAIALDPRNDYLDQEKARDLIRIFRPERNGEISMINFVSSIDTVYKELRLLSKYLLPCMKKDLGCHVSR
jgi:hypothetical protein